MKPAVFLTLILCALAFAEIRSQSNTGTIMIGRPNLPTMGDSINSGQSICLDTSVTSFMVTVICKNGAIYERKYFGNCTGIQPMAGSGSKVVCSEIVSVPQQGVRVRLPVRTFYVR